MSGYVNSVLACGVEYIYKMTRTVVFCIVAHWDFETCNKVIGFLHGRAFWSRVWKAASDLSQSIMLSRYVWGFIENSWVWNRGLWRTKHSCLCYAFSVSYTITGKRFQWMFVHTDIKRMQHVFLFCIIVKNIMMTNNVDTKL